MPRSQAEVKLAGAVLGGKAKESSMDKKYAREVIRKMRGKSMKSLPKHAASKPSKKKYYERAKEK
jgi:hypothetical protein